MLNMVESLSGVGFGFGRFRFQGCMAMWLGSVLHQWCGHDVHTCQAIILPLLPPPPLHLHLQPLWENPTKWF